MALVMVAEPNANLTLSAVVCTCTCMDAEPSNTLAACALTENVFARVADALSKSNDCTTVMVVAMASVLLMSLVLADVEVCCTLMAMLELASKNRRPDEVCVLTKFSWDSPLTITSADADSVPAFTNRVTAPRFAFPSMLIDNDVDRVLDAETSLRAAVLCVKELDSVLVPNVTMIADANNPGPQTKLGSVFHDSADDHVSSNLLIRSVAEARSRSNAEDEIPKLEGSDAEALWILPAAVDVLNWLAMVLVPDLRYPPPAWVMVMFDVSVALARSRSCPTCTVLASTVSVVEVDRVLTADPVCEMADDSVACPSMVPW